jgi:hypothetical protein
LAQILDQTTSNSAVAVQIQNAAGNTLFDADTSGMNITITGPSASSFATLALTNAHFESTQTTAPTIGTPASCGTGGGVASAITAGSTDSAGSFSITSGNGTQGVCTTIITFHTAYAAAPKSIILSESGAVGGATGRIPGVVTAIGTTTFTVALATVPASTGLTYAFYYWIIE